MCLGCTMGKPQKRLGKGAYEDELFRLQAELVKVQEWVRASGARIVIVFEGRDAAGKGGAIKRITQYLNPRVARIAALPTPTDRQKSQWYFQRYVEHLPAGGEIVLFDRSWYNRAGVEQVLGFCTPEEHERFLHQCPIFERMLVEDGILLRKYWFSVSDEEQQRRFRGRVDDPMRRWKLSTTDFESVLALGGLLPRQGRDDGAHRHPRGAVVRRRGRREEGGAAQHDRAPPLHDPVRRGGAATDRGARPAGQRPATSGRRASSRRTSPTTSATLLPDPQRACARSRDPG